MVVGTVVKRYSLKRGNDIWCRKYYMLTLIKTTAMANLTVIMVIFSISSHNVQRHTAALSKQIHLTIQSACQINFVTKQFNKFVIFFFGISVGISVKKNVFIPVSPIQGWTF